MNKLGKLRGDVPRIMGILNLTDNSFVPGSRSLRLDGNELAAKVAGLFEDGADIVDIGACSTAPGNDPVDEQEEWRRLEKALEILFGTFPDKEFSLDTFRPGIVRKALRLGHKFIVNDVSGGLSADCKMLTLVQLEGLQYVATCPSANPHEYFTLFSRQAEKLGLKDWIADPGFGFGKSLEQNWDILHKLHSLKDFGKPILVALSRKRMIYEKEGLTPETCADQSVQAELLAIANGADIVRTHDVGAVGVSNCWPLPCRVTDL